MIRKMSKTDLSRIVTIHLTCFPGFFLSFLGPGFLRLYYEGICSDHAGIGFVFVDKLEIPVGFVAGTTNPSCFYSRLLKRDWLRFSLASVGAICKKPIIIRRIARAFYYPAENPVGENVAGLFSIGVLPELQRTGAGKKLVLAFLEEAQKRCCNKVFLTTDRDSNDDVNSFYKSLGFQIKRQFVSPEGRRMNEYWIDINNKE